SAGRLRRRDTPNTTSARQDAASALLSMVSKMLATDLASLPAAARPIGSWRSLRAIALIEPLHELPQRTDLSRGQGTPFDERIEERRVGSRAQLVGDELELAADELLSIDRRREHLGAASAVARDEGLGHEAFAELLHRGEVGR